MAGIEREPDCGTAQTNSFRVYGGRGQGRSGAPSLAGQDPRANLMPVGRVVSVLFILVFLGGLFENCFVLAVPFPMMSRRIDLIGLPSSTIDLMLLTRASSGGIPFKSLLVTSSLSRHFSRAIPDPNSRILLSRTSNTCRPTSSLLRVVGMCNRTSA